MAVPQRRRSEFTQQIVPLLLLGAGLVTTNHTATILAGEARALSLATQPLHTTLARVFSGNESLDSHPPLFDFLLHFWLQWTGGNFDYLRIPSILFFLAGLFLLGRASRLLTGNPGGSAVIWAGVLWPLGFHYSRLAIAPVFSFFLVCGLTFAYLKYLEKQNLAHWIAFVLFAFGLIWTTYLGWAILACLAIDVVLRARGREFAGNLRGFAWAGCVLFASFLPFLPGMRNSIRPVVPVRHVGFSTVVNFAASVYSLFVSESVAPWYWRWSIPAALAVLLCVTLAVWFGKPHARLLLVYALFLIVPMAIFGVLNVDRMLLVSPWILLPVGISVDAEKPRSANFSLAAALLIVGAIGWYGIYSRRYYSSLQWIEPWENESADAAGKVRDGAKVIADHPSLLFYLTYDLQIPSQGGTWKFEGLVTEFVQHPQVFSPAGWLSSGHPAGSKMILVRGAEEPEGGVPMDEAAKQLDQSCGSISSRHMLRDQGYAWKQRFLPSFAESPWRIEVREYDCESTNSREIFHIPAIPAQ